MRFRTFDEWWAKVREQVPWSDSDKSKAEAAFNAGRNDGYRVISSMESFGSEGNFGCRIAVMLPEEMFIVFDYDKMVGEALDPKNHDFTKTGLAPEFFVGSQCEDVLDQIKRAYEHVNPAVKKQREDAKNLFYQMFVKAGFTPIFMQEIPNEYWGNAYYAWRYPWFIVTTTIGHIKIGSRKRVINIDWKDSIVKIKGTELSSDDVTRGDTYIHAWSDEKAVEYLKALHTKAASHV